MEALTIDQARAALERHVRTTRFGRREISATLPIESFEASGAHHVRFESFTEARNVVPDHVPYRGGEVDGPERGPAPEPWAITVARPPDFTAKNASYEVPHTAVVRTCHVCGGDGRVSCGHCGGSGRVTCGRCGGTGSVTNSRTVTRTDANGQTHTETETYSESCTCFSGRVSCGHCGGDGRVTCGTCQGACRLRHYQRLDVVWAHHVTEQVLESTDLPDAMIPKAEGAVVLGEEAARVEPTPGTGDGGGAAFRSAPMRVRRDVDAACNALINAAVFQGARLHRQRLTVRVVPVYEARYRWGKHARRFWVYGLDQRVHAPQYPLSPGRVGLAIGGSVGALGGGAALIASLGAGAPAAPSEAPPPYAVTASQPATEAEPAPTETPYDRARAAILAPAVDPSAASDADGAAAGVDAAASGRAASSPPARANARRHHASGGGGTSRP